MQHVRGVVGPRRRRSGWVAVRDPRGSYLRRRLPVGGARRRPGPIPDGLRAARAAFSTGSGTRRPRRGCLDPRPSTGAAAYTNVDMTLTTSRRRIIVPVLSINNEKQGLRLQARSRHGRLVQQPGRQPAQRHPAGSIALDSTRKMHVCFYEPTARTSCTPPRRGTTRLAGHTVDITGNVGDYCSIAVTPAITSTSSTTTRRTATSSTRR